MNQTNIKSLIRKNYNNSLNELAANLCFFPYTGFFWKFFFLRIIKTINEYIIFNIYFFEIFAIF
jgi:hypothetical protein